MVLLDEVMPSYERHEVHSRATAAPESALWDAVHDLRGDELRVTRALMGLRTLGRDADADRTVLEGFRRMGFRPVAADPGRELVVAGIGRFWKPSAELLRVSDRDHFTEFDEPGYAKVAFNFRIADGQLATETRIATTDAHARRRFNLYWLLIRPGSGLIRREWLHALEKRALLAPPS